MITRGISDFLARDWEAARDAKDDYWAERIARLGPVEGLRIADELRRQVLRQKPGWPTARDRREDLRLTPDDPAAFAADMAAAGFTLRVDDPDFVRRTRVMPFVHTATGMPVDVVLAGSGLEDEFLARARGIDIGGTEIPTIDPADLI